MGKSKYLISVGIHREDERGNVYTLLNRRGLTIEWNGKKLTVPRYFESDGASVPRFFWRAVFPSSDPRAIRAAFAHDYIYRMHPEGWSKKEADAMFYDLLVEDGVSVPCALIAFKGVDWFGGHAWKEQGGLADASGE